VGEEIDQERARRQPTQRPPDAAAPDLGGVCVVGRGLLIAHAQFYLMAGKPELFCLSPIDRSHPGLAQIRRGATERIMKTLLTVALAAPLLCLTLTLAAPAASAAPLRANAAQVEQAGPSTLVRHMDRGRHRGWRHGRGHHTR
jgi:hypothetical protein